MQRRTLIQGWLSAASLASLSLEVKAHELELAKASVIVIGSGAAGLSAALSAVENGAQSVVVLEKLPFVGGHSIFSSGSVSSESTPEGIASMQQDMLTAGRGKADPELVRVLCENAHDARMWLKSYGLTWQKQPYQAVGSPTARSYSTGSAQAGYDYIQLLNDTVRRYGVRIEFRLQAQTLIYEDEPKRVVGTLATKPDGTRVLIRAQAVILATGGFQASQKMRRRFCPQITPSLKTTANPSGKLMDGAEGDAIIMTDPLDAKLVNMSDVQILPFSGGRLLDYAGGEIWINALGKRFVNEGTVSFSDLYAIIMRQPQQTMWVISDAKSKKGATLGTKLHSGIVHLAQSVEELARSMDISVETLRETLSNYNRFVRQGYDEELGCRLNAETIDTPPYYFGLEKFSLHYCCGGLAIDTHARVLNNSQQPIYGLYACGEVTGGVHGADRLGGHGLIDCFVFGRIAGCEAAKLKAGI